MASVPGGPPPVIFHTAFERLRDLMNKDDAHALASTTMEDVWTAARDIERQLELRRSLRGLRRIQPFLAGIEQYSKVVEVVCNGTPYLPYLWAPIKLLLQIAQNHISALERLIDAYAMIGEAMPRFDRLSGVFKDDPEFLQVMGHFYEDVLEFHRRAYKFFRRRAWKLVFDSLWKTFDSRFQSILQSLRKHRDLIDQEASTIDIVEAKIWRGQQMEQIRQWRAERAKDLDNVERDRLAMQTREAVVWFGASQEQEDILAKLLRACDSTDSHWALREPMILSWLEHSRDNQFIWLHGKPGAGKSVISAKVIEHVQDATDDVVIFYFCSHQQTSLSQANDILRSFATQLLAANTELAPYILDTFAYQALRPTKKHLGVILEKMITTASSVRVVVDGLDECATSEQEEIIGDLLKIKGPVSGACKILLSCRKLPSIFRLLHGKPTLRLDDRAENVNATISLFVHQRLGSLRQDFDSDMLDELEGQIKAKANGMFLWVRLVMFTLEYLHFESDIREAMQTLPEGLEAIYEKILSHICGSSKSPNQRTATRILQWMLVARRPLKRVEIESGIILDDRVSQVTLATRPRGDVLSSCYPILDVEDGPCGHVSFCHFTALEYLRTVYNSPALQFPPAQLTVSLACVQYLTSSLDLVDPGISKEETRSQIVQCFHDLQLYANDHWVEHLSALKNSLADSIPCGPLMLCLSQGLERLTKRHNELAKAKAWNTQDDTVSLPSATGNGWPHLGLSVSSQSLLNKVSAYRCKVAEGDQIADNSSDPDWQDPTLFSSVRARYQSILEELLEHNNLNAAASADFIARHHSGSYLCHYRSCPRAIQGFSSSNLRQEHEISHTSRFSCTDSACGFFGRALKSRAAMNKHNTKYHSSDGLAAIPTSFRKASARPQEDRSRFLLNEPPSPSRKRSFQAAEDDKVMSEVHVATNPASNVKSSSPSKVVHQEASIIKCICGNYSDDGNTVYCYSCDTWQHIECYYRDKDGNVPPADEIEILDHFCVDCQPRSLDAKGAKERQMKRNERIIETFSPRYYSSNWTVGEQKDFHNLVRRHGTNWEVIASHLKTKNYTMVMSFYERSVANGDRQLKEDAMRADEYFVSRISTELAARKSCMYFRNHQQFDPNKDSEEYIACSICGDHSHIQCVRDLGLFKTTDDPSQWRCSSCEILVNTANTASIDTPEQHSLGLGTSAPSTI